MDTVGLVLVVIAAWFVGSIPLALLVGRIIGRCSTERPTRVEPQPAEQLELLTPAA